MRRLIDADYFKEQIVDASLMHKIDPKKMLAWTGLIDVMPTAYDVDKVVDELKQEIQNGTIKIEDGNSRLFKIVMQGGVERKVE